MRDELHPAVRDVAATGAIGVGAGAAALGGALAVDPPGDVLLIAAVAIVVTPVLAPLRLPRSVREIVEELAQAWWLRRFEQLNDLRLLYRPVYRWAGTNGRALGRGWFDPANFVETD